MLLTIYNLPDNTRYIDVKSLIETKCGIKEMILDNLVSWGAFMKVTVGLATEEDAAILVRKINGLFINGTQLHVEDVRKRKQAIEQPYYSTTRKESYPDQHQDQSAYMDQSNEHNVQHNLAASATLPSYYAQSFTPYMPNGSPAKNIYNSYEGQPAVQYPTPQRTYETPDQAHQEPLGFRSEGNSTPWSQTQGGSNQMPKTSFSQRDDRRWSPKRGQQNERSQRPSRWGDDGSDRDNGRHHSPPRDRRPNYERDEPNTSRSAYGRDNFHRSDNRSPQRTDRFAPKTNRDSNAPEFGKARQSERESFKNPNNPKAKIRGRRRPKPNFHQPWSDPGLNAGSFKTQNRVEQMNRPAKKRNSEQNIDEQPQKRMRPPPILKELKLPINKSKTGVRYSAEEYAKVEEFRSTTWRGQTASQIAKDMMRGKTVTDVDRALFFKELKRIVRDRLSELCHPLMRHDSMYIKYRKLYKIEEDDKVFQEVLENVIQTKLRQKSSKKAEEPALKAKAEKHDEVKSEILNTETTPTQEDFIPVPTEKTPSENIGGTFKVPAVPKNKPAAPVMCDMPKYTKGELFKFKRQKQQSKRMFQHENTILKSLDSTTRDAIEYEAALLLENFLEECQGCHSEDKSLTETMRNTMQTTVADDFKRVMKVQVARRILNEEEPMLRVFCSPKLLKLDRLMPFLKSQEITAVKKTKKLPMLLASCKSYRVHDRLCTAEPFKVHDRVITFRPLQVAGPPVKVTKDKINQQRKQFIKNQIHNDLDPSAMKLMNDIQKLQDDLEDDYCAESRVETSGILKTEVSVDDTEGVSCIDNANIRNSDSIKGEDKSQNDCVINVKFEDFSEDVDFSVAQKDMSVDDYQIVEDTIGNFNNNEGAIDCGDEQNGGIMGEVIEQDGGIMGDVIEQGGGIMDAVIEQGGGIMSDVIEQGGGIMSDVIEQDGGIIDDVIEQGGGIMNDVIEQDGGITDDVIEKEVENIDNIEKQDVGNVANIDDVNGENMVNIGEKDSGNMKDNDSKDGDDDDDDDEQDGEDIDDEDCEDLEIGDIDENDLEDY